MNTWHDILFFASNTWHDIRRASELLDQETSWWNFIYAKLDAELICKDVVCVTSVKYLANWIMCYTIYHCKMSLTWSYVLAWSQDRRATRDACITVVDVIKAASDVLKQGIKNWLEKKR